MILCSYLSILLCYGLVDRSLSASIISLKEDLDEASYTMDQTKAQNQVIDPVNIYLYPFIHKQTGACIKMMTIQHVNHEDYFLDSFQVTCDVNPAFHKVGNTINIANIVYIIATPGVGIFSILKMGNECIQRRYTDANQAPLDEIEEMRLTPAQCQQLVAQAVPVATTTTVAPTAAASAVQAVTNPVFGVTQGKIIQMDDNGIDEYINDVTFTDKEENGVAAKMIVSKYIREANRECRMLISVDVANSEDFLDSVQATCDARAALVKSRGMLVYGGLVYLGDKKGDPIWGLFLMTDHCMLRQYTDGSHKLIEKQSRRITWTECQRVVATQNINWLPKLPTKPLQTTSDQPAQPLSALLDFVKSLIHKMAALFPIPLGFKPHQPGTPFTPQPLDNKPVTPVLTPQPLTAQPLTAQAPNTQAPRPPVATQAPRPPVATQVPRPQVAAQVPQTPLAAQTGAPLTGSPPLSPVTQQPAAAASPPPKKGFWPWG